MNLEEVQKLEEQNVNNKTLPNVNSNVTDKVGALKMLFEYDFMGCDAKWALFVAAAQSYRYEAELNPFPEQFQNEKERDINALIATITDTPRLQILHQMLEEGKESEINRNIIDLIHWVLVVQQLPTLRLLLKEEQDVLTRHLQVSANHMPTHIFELQVLPDSKREKEFTAARNSFECGFGFYGDQLDRFFALLLQGFDKYRSECNNFTGNVLELTPILDTALFKSPAAAAWGFSACGSVISAVAVCEYIANPHFLKLTTREDSKGALHFETIDISESNLVRIRYLFIYGNRTADIEANTAGSEKSWLKRNRSYLSLALSFAMVMTALAVSGRGGQIKEFCTKSVNKAFSICRRAMKLNLPLFK